MKQEIIFEVGHFKPTEDFLKFLNSLGYNSFTLEARMDKRMIQWLYENGSSFDGYLIYKGNLDYQFKIGFSGLLVVIPIDTEKNWRIIPYGKRDLIQVEYIELHRSSIGQTFFVPTGEYDIPILFNSSPKRN